MKFDHYDQFHREHKNEPLRALWLIFELNQNIAHNQKKIMSALSDLTTAVGAGTQASADLKVSVDSAIAILQGGSANDSQLVALTAQATASATAIGVEKAKLDAAVTAAQPQAPTVR